MHPDSYLCQVNTVAVDCLLMIYQCLLAVFVNIFFNYYVSCVMRKHVHSVSNRSDSNQAVEVQKIKIRVANRLQVKPSLLYANKWLIFYGCT